MNKEGDIVSELATDDAFRFTDDLGPEQIVQIYEIGTGLKAVVVIGVLAILFLVFVGGALSLYLIFGDDGVTSVHASVVQTEAGDGLKVEVGDAPSGMRVRFAGQELAIEDGAATFPLAADTPEERAAVGRALREHLDETVIVLVEGRRVPELPADELPEPRRAGVERLRDDAVVARGALDALAHPRAVVQHLEVTAHRGLGQLKCAGELADAQLLAMKQPQDPQAGEITERVEPGDERRRRSLHPGPTDPAATRQSVRGSRPAP